MYNQVQLAQCYINLISCSDGVPGNTKEFHNSTHIAYYLFAYKMIHNSEAVTWEYYDELLNKSNWGKLKYA